MKKTIRNVEQSAPAGEREAFELASVDDSFGSLRALGAEAERRGLENGDYIDFAARKAWEYFQAGAAWQRAQAAGVPEGWREDVFLAAQMLTWGDADGGLTERQITEIEQHAKKLFDMLAAAPSQPASDKGEVQRLREALEHARLFIRNGIYLGYIRMPDADTPDPAHETLPMIDATLAASTGQEVE